MSFLPNPHPVFVHFTIGLYLSGVGFALIGWALKKDSARQAALWAIVTAAALSALTVLTGWLAAGSVPHGGGEVHELIERHELLALVSLGVLLLAGAGHLWAATKRRPDWVPGSALIISVIGAALLLATGAAGGKLVFVHGVGVKAVPVAAGHSHHHGAAGHDHGLGESDSHAAEGEAPPPDEEESEQEGEQGHVHEHEQGNGDEPSQSN